MNRDLELRRQLQRMPNLGEALRKASKELQRRLFEAFDLRIAYDKVGGRIEISVTLWEGVAGPGEVQSPPDGGLQVVAKGIAGAGFEPATFGL